MYINIAYVQFGLLPPPRYRDPAVPGVSFYFLMSLRVSQRPLWFRSLALRWIGAAEPWVCALTSSLPLCLPASAATGRGHHGVLRAGAGAGGTGGHVLQQLLPLPALGPGPGPEQRRLPVAAERAAGLGAFCRYKGALRRRRRRRKIVQNGRKDAAGLSNWGAG